MLPTPKYKKCKNMKNVKNENHQKLIILEGFSQHGLHHWIQRNFLRIVAPVKIDFRHFPKMFFFCKRAPLICPQGQTIQQIESQKALSHVLTFSNARARRELSIDVLYVTRASICVELRPFYWSKRIWVPMSYITFFENLAVLVPTM